MTGTTKVMLSELEEMLIRDTRWILTKHAIMEKVAVLLSAQVDCINREFTRPLLPVLPELGACLPKISKGEKYLGLPYMILDYPAIFSRTDCFALRTMFWWGHFFSVTLHLSGKYKQAFEKQLLAGITKGEESLYVSTGEEEWQHHFEPGNYLPVSAMAEDLLHKKIVQPSFVKIALKYDLVHWNNMNDLLKDAYSKTAFMLQR